MSSIAKKMLERHGWKEGMGLGKNAQGVKTYVKVVRRDPHSATGLGHAADASQAPQASTFALELDAVYSTLQKKKGKREASGERGVEEGEEERSEGSVSEDDAQKKKREKRARSQVCSNSSSSSDSEKHSTSSDDDEEEDDNDKKGQVDITRLTDAELLRRCGGVRLGRAGRHRLFDGKLRRIEESHQRNSAASGSRLADELARLGDRVAKADTSQQQQASSLGLVQRQQAVLERRVAALEEAEGRLARRVAEAARMASDVALRHKGVEEMVRQVERLVLDRPAQASPGNAQKDTQGEAQGVAEKETQRERVAELGRQVEALRARVEQLTLEKIVVERVQAMLPPHQAPDGEQRPPREAKETGKAQESGEEVSHAVEAAVARVAGGAGPRALAEALRHTGAFPFKDNTGATRVSSQRVLVRHVPLTCGAAEVRVICGRVGQVVSCTVRQTASTAATGARYRSQQSEEAEAEQTVERAFEVTFRTAEEAVRAVLQLDGHRLQAGAVIAVEPLVSADIIAALHRLEETKKGSGSKN